MAAMRIRSLEAQIEALQKAPAAAPAPGSAPAAAPAGDDQQPEVVPYGLTIPNEVATAIFGEDAATAHNALNHMVSSLASAIHTRVLHQVRGEQRTALATIEQTRQEQVGTTAAVDMQKQFYDKFPQYSDPVYQPIIYAVNSQLAAELPNHPWDDNYMAALGSRVTAHMARLAGGAAPAAPAPAAVPQPRPAAMVPTAAPRAGSHAIPAFEQDLPDQVTDIFRA